MITRIILLLLFSTSGYSQTTQKTWLPEKTKEEEAYSLGIQAYIYYNAPFMLYNIIYQGQRVPYLDHKEGMPFNTWTRIPELGNAKNATRVVMPNCNTLYASAFLDLREEPVLLEIPVTGDRYFSVALMDAYSNNFQIIGSRTVGPYGGKFLLSYGNFKSPVPEGITKIESPTPLVWAIQRIAPKVANHSEIEACKKIQEAITLTPVSQIGKPGYNALTYNQKLDLGTPDISENPLKYFEIATKYASMNTPPLEDRGLLASFSRLGLGADGSFQESALSKEQKTGLLRGMEAGRAIINEYTKKNGVFYNGWNLPPADAGVYGTNYLLRASYAVERVGALLPAEAMYLTSYTDIDGQNYDGSKKYVMHFEKSEIPQVDAFWSIILYEVPSLLFYDNPIDRYQMGPQIEEMKYNKDGSLDIYIQHDPPKDPKIKANWLPAPKGKFMLTLRLYNARPAMFYIGPGKTPMPGVKPL
jgi:hypothetical protein